MSIQFLSANHAAGAAATLAGRANRTGRGFGGGIYPITPQSECIEYLCNQEFEKGHFVRVESEHSAMGVCMGFAFSGARTFTASSSNGLAYMTENVIAAALYRLPVVMMAVNRTLGPPWNIWVDHGDTLLLRDAGWTQFYCEDNQEVFDSILAGYRLAEDPRILIPCLVCQDAFVLSHTMMNTEIPDQELVDRFLPALDLPHRITDRAVTVGGLDFPHETEAHRVQHAQAMDRVWEVYPEVQAEFAAVFGRPLADPVVPYRMEDARIVLVSMGTTAATVRAAVDEARAKGIPAGSLRVRMFRPFPERILGEYLAGRPRIAILDRDISLGHGGVLWSETRGTVRHDCVLQNYVIGLGGGDIRPQHAAEIIADIGKRDRIGEPMIMEIG
ncbi:MAG: pyruvate ferredoxin oxidoreductase [Planctomycetota bacterium]